MKKRCFNYQIMQSYIKEKGLTIKRFCEMCGITYYQYRQIVKDDVNIYISALFRVSVVIGIPFYEMFKV